MGRYRQGPYLRRRGVEGFVEVEDAAFSDWTLRFPCLKINMATLAQSSQTRDLT